MIEGRLSPQILERRNNHLGGSYVCKGKKILKEKHGYLYVCSIGFLTSPKYYSRCIQVLFLCIFECLCLLYRQSYHQYCCVWIHRAFRRSNLHPGNYQLQEEAERQRLKHTFRRNTKGCLILEKSNLTFFADTTNLQRKERSCMKSMYKGYGVQTKSK